MQAQNAVSIEYFKNSKRFADLLNGYFFNGDEVVHWESVRERDPVLQKIKRKGTKVTTKANIVDLFRNVEIDGCRIGVILQNQTKIHYLVQVITVFSCKLQGKRANKAKKLIRELIQEEADGKSHKSNVDTKQCTEN